MKQREGIYFKCLNNEIEFLIRINHFDSNHINKLLYGIIHDGILTLEECQEHADTVKRKKL